MRKKLIFAVVLSRSTGSVCWRQRKWEKGEKYLQHINPSQPVTVFLEMTCVLLRVNVFQPGESWMMEDGCHSVLCHPSGAVTVLNHKVSCDRLEPPACSNNMPPVRVEETCGCHWECPCMYIKRIKWPLAAHLTPSILSAPHFPLELLTMNGLHAFAIFTNC